MMVMLFAVAVVSATTLACAAPAAATDAADNYSMDIFLNYRT